MDSEIASLSKKLSPLIWVLRAVCNDSRKSKAYDYWTGFTVGKGLVMTTMSGFNRNIKGGITARRIDMETFSSAKAIFGRESMDVMILKVNPEDGEDVDVDFSHIGRLASDGSISDGEVLYSIANSHELVKSLLIGRASYCCVNEVSLPPYEENSECFTYEFTPEATTPVYRQMGHVWNTCNFRKYGMMDEGRGKTWDQIKRYKKIHPRIPIIQCHGFLFDPTSSGAPIFNSQGEIVGMLNSKVDVIDVAIHVSVLKVALEDEKVKQTLASDK